MHPGSLSSGLDWLSLRINRIAEISVGCLGLTMTGVVILQVFFRYGLNHSLFWSEELARYLLIWLTFLGTSVAYHRSAHPSVNLLQSRLSPARKRQSRIFVHGVSLVFFLILVWYGLEFAYFVRAQTTPALSLPKWLVFSIIPVSGTILVLHCLAFLRRDLAGVRS